MSQQVLTQKWRPRRFEEVIGQQHVVQTLVNALSQNHLHHAYLFTGTRGVGKTTIARIIAKCFNCETGVSATPCGTCDSCQEIDTGRFPDFYEVDAASRTKVEDTRELLESVQYAPSKGRFKIYLIDEVHMLSGHSFNALLKTLEEPPEHVKFLLATTDPQKLPATVLSRCLQLHLLHLTVEQLDQHLQHILHEEKIEFDTVSTQLLAKAAQGSVRDSLSLLDQSIAFGNGRVVESDIKVMLGTIEPTLIFDLLNALADKDANKILSISESLSELGANFSQALADLLSALHQITLAQLLRDDANTDDAIKQLANKLTPEDVQLYYQIGLIGQRDLSLAPTASSGFEMILLRMLAFIPNQTITTKQPQASQPAAAAPSAPSQSPQPTVSPKAPANSLDEKWYQLSQAINLTGAAKALAEQCHVQSWTDDELKLTVSPKLKAFVLQRNTDRISAAIATKLNKNIFVSINIDEPNKAAETSNPAAIKEEKKQTRQLDAEKKILNDEKVQRIIKTFDASVVKDSVIPTDK